MLDPQTRRCHYTFLAQQFASYAPLLMQDWLTRREVFERLGNTSGDQASPPVSQPAAGSESDQAIDAAVNLSKQEPAAESAERAVDTGALPNAVNKPPSTSTALSLIWMVLVGSLVLIVVLCACLSALLLARDIPLSRAAIEAANATTASTQSSLIGTTMTVAALMESPSSPLQSPLATPNIESSSIAGLLSGTVESGQFPTPIHYEAATGLLNATPTPTEPAFLTPVVPTEQHVPVNPTYPSTFTPIPVTLPTLTLLPATSTTSPVMPSVTITPTGIVTTTPTLTPSPTYGPSISSAIVISTVMYAGNPNTNYSNQYIEIQNRGGVAVNISGWSLRTTVNAKEFTFTTGIILQPGWICQVYGNTPPSSTGDCGPFSFNSPTSILATTHDRVELIDQNANVVGVYNY